MTKNLTIRLDILPWPLEGPTTAAIDGTCATVSERILCDPGRLADLVGELLDRQAMTR